MRLSALIEKFTYTLVKDCFREGETIYLVVGPGELGKVVGKGGVTVKRIQQEIGKPVRVIEYRDNVVDFIKNVIYPLAVQEIVVEEKAVILKDRSKKTKSLLIGRDGRNLQVINRAVGRFFDKEVRIA